MESMEYNGRGGVKSTEGKGDGEHGGKGGGKHGYNWVGLESTESKGSGEGHRGQGQGLGARRAGVGE